VVAACFNSNKIGIWWQIMLKQEYWNEVALCFNSRNIEIFWQRVVTAELLKFCGS